MKRFKCTVEHVDEYIIEIDDTQFDKNRMEEFRQNICDFTTLEEHAAHIAQLRARFGTCHFEGYGVPLINGRNVAGNKRECDKACWKE